MDATCFNNKNIHRILPFAVRSNGIESLGQSNKQTHHSIIGSNMASYPSHPADE